MLYCYKCYKVSLNSQMEEDRIRIPLAKKGALMETEAKYPAKIGPIAPPKAEKAKVLLKSRPLEVSRQAF